MRIIDLRPKNLYMWVIIAFMIFVPMFYFSDPRFGVSAMRVSQTQIFQVLSIALCAIFIIQNIYLGSFLLISTISYAYFSFPLPAGVTLLNILGGCLLYEATYRVVNKDNYNMIFQAIIWICLYNLLYATLQINGFEVLYTEYRQTNYQNGFLGFMGLKAIFGILIAFSAPFIMQSTPYISGLLIIPAVLTESSCAVVSVAFSFLWNIYFTKRRLFYVMLAVLTIGASAYAYKDSGTGMFTDRANMWKVVLQDAVKKPLTGYGMDSFRCVTPDKSFMYVKNVRTLETFRIRQEDLIEYQNTKIVPNDKYAGHYVKGDTLDIWDNPHNEFIQLLYEFGFIPFFILGFMIYDIKRRFEKHSWQIPLISSFIAVAILSIGQFPFHLARVVIYPIIFYAVYCKLSDIHSPKEIYYGT